MRKRTIVGGIVGGLIVIGAVGAAMGGDQGGAAPAAGGQSSAVASGRTAGATQMQVQVQEEGTASQRSALRAARGYVEMSGFSRRGLIGQLSSPHGDQFTHAQATHAADKLGLK